MAVSTAEKFLREFALIPHTDDGRWLDHEILAGFRARLTHSAVDWWDVCKESCDSTRKYVFPDGSALELANPLQECFIADCYKAN